MRLACLTTICSAALLGACATAYKPESLGNRGGYSETKRAPGVWQVWFVGNAQTTQDKADDFAMLRGAELCLAEGRPFMRAANFDSRADFIGSHENRLYQFRSTVEITCLAEKSGDAQEAAAVAADIRKRYRIAAPRPASQAFQPVGAGDRLPPVIDDGASLRG